MADLNDLAAAQTIKIVGSDLTGLETFAVDSTSDGRLKVNGATTEVSHLNRIDVSSLARTTSGNSGTLDSAGFGTTAFSIAVTAISGANAAFQISLDVSEDTTNWVEIMKTARMTAVGFLRLQRISLSAKYYRYRWTVTGTTPSITFSITSTLKAYSGKRNVVVSNYADISLTTVSNVSSVFNAADANNISIMTIRAADGGNGGAFRVQASNDSINWADISANISQNANTTILTAFNNQSFRYYRLIVQSNTNAGTRVLDIHWGAS